MYTYIFYVCKGDGISISLEVHSLASDDVASDWAQKVLAQHPTADYVSVARGEVTVATRRRGHALFAATPELDAFSA